MHFIAFCDSDSPFIFFLCVSHWASLNNYLVTRPGSTLVWIGIVTTWFYDPKCYSAPWLEKSPRHSSMSLAAINKRCGGFQSMGVAMYPQLWSIFDWDFPYFSMKQNHLAEIPHLCDLWKPEVSNSWEQQWLARSHLWLKMLGKPLKTHIAMKWYIKWQ